MEKDITARIRNLIGQLEAIVRLRDSGVACEQQIMQLKAIRAGVNAVMQKIIEKELAQCSKLAERKAVTAKLFAELVSHASV
jgi:DNA-binding FrmR family transcriptional regulator